jgi:hypothetical protein
VDPGGGNAAGLDERKVATVAVAAASDAMTQFWFTNENARGLRGGASSPDWSGWPYRQGVDLVDWAFTEDVYVSGSAFFNVGPLDSFWWWGDCSDWESGGGCLGDYSFVADLTVSGPGTGGGQLHVEGRRMAPPPVGKLKVTGTLGGKQVAVLVPEG